MTVREPAAPHFYAGDCARATERFLRDFSPPAQPQRIVAGIVPHAGWDYSGAVAAKVFESIRRKTNPATFVFFGAVHRWAGGNAVYARGAWATPLGNIAVDEELASRIVGHAAGLATENAAAHDGEGASLAGSEQGAPQSAGAQHGPFGVALFVSPHARRLESLQLASCPALFSG